MILNGAGGTKLGVLYEHQGWLDPLFLQLDRRGVPYEAVDLRRHRYQVGERPSYGVALNRMSPSAHTRGNRNAMTYTSQLLAELESSGVRVLNGHRAYLAEVSKAYQLGVLQALGVPYPRTVVINHPKEAAAAAERLSFPVVVKPNVGGSGAGIRRFDTLAELEAAEAELELGIDQTGLVQEFIQPAEGRIIRVEFVNGEHLYSISVDATGGFNLCPADLCLESTGGGSRRAERAFPEPEILHQVGAILEALKIDVGGVEYVVAADGQRYFYDVNALSNFVADAANVIGFDPYERLAEYLEGQLQARPD